MCPCGVLPYNPVAGARLACGDACGPVPPARRVPVQVAEATVGSAKRGGAQGGEEGSCAQKVRRLPFLADVASQRFEPSQGCLSKLGPDNVQVCPLQHSGKCGACIGQAAVPPSGAAECPFLLVCPCAVTAGLLLDCLCVQGKYPACQLTDDAGKMLTRRARLAEGQKVWVVGISC